MSNSVNLSLDVTKTGIQNPLIKVRQGDGGFETLHTTVTSNGEPLDLQGWTITFMGTTAGNHKIVDGNVNIVEAPNGIFDYTPSKAWGMDIGDFKMAYFKFVKGDGAASSANFRVSVIEAVDLTQEEAQNYISVVDTIIAEIRDHLTNSLADVTDSIADTSSVASSMAVYVSSTASSAVSEVSSAASSASSVATSAAAKVSGVAAQVNSLSVGGRNLLLGTEISFTGIGNGSTNGNFDAQGGKFFLADGKNVSDLYKKYGPSGYLTLSFDWLASGSTISGTFNAQWDNTPWEFISPNVTIKPSITNKSGHYKVTFPLNTNDYSNAYADGVQFRQDNLQGNITISNIKLEAGNIATDWTPAPEDAPSNDAQLVHKTGTETIAGDKTFTGNNKFTSPIDGALKSREATFTDFAYVAKNMFAYAGNWFTNATAQIANSPYQNTLGIVEVIPGDTSSSGRIIFTPYDPSDGNIYYNSVSWRGLGPWVKVANDANAVHKTGTETIAGDKTFTGMTNIQNQKQYTASFTIGANTINLTRIGSIVYVNARIREKINASASYGVIPAGFTPANNAVISFIVNNTQGSCLFQANQNNVWFPADAPFDSNMSGSYLTSDALPS